MVDSKNKTEPTIQLPTPTPDNPVVMAWKKTWGGELIVAFHSPTSGIVLFDESTESRGLRQMTNLIQFDRTDYWELYTGSLRLDIVTHYPAATPKPPVQTTPTPPSAGDGYRFLTLGETIKKGDEVTACGGGWQPVEYTIGQSCQNPSAFRRPVVSQPTSTLPAAQRKFEPGEGYRRLAPGETLLETDEVGFRDRGEVAWRRTFHAGKTVGEWPCNCTYRRRIETPAPVTYRTLAVGEVYADGDELFNTQAGKWQKRGPSLGTQHRKEFCETRRPVCVQSPGYRFLDQYEVVQDGDEMKCADGGWTLMLSSIGKQVRTLAWDCRRKF